MAGTYVYRSLSRLLVLSLRVEVKFCIMHVQFCIHIIHGTQSGFGGWGIRAVMAQSEDGVLAIVSSSRMVSH